MLTIMMRKRPRKSVHLPAVEKLPGGSVLFRNALVIRGVNVHRQEARASDRPALIVLLEKDLKLTLGHHGGDFRIGRLLILWRSDEALEKGSVPPPRGADRLKDRIRSP